MFAVPSPRRLPYSSPNASLRNGKGRGRMQKPRQNERYREKRALFKEVDGAKKKIHAPFIPPRWPGRAPSGYTLSMESEDSLEGKRILVVEDDAEIADLILAYLRKEGAAAEKAGSAEEAQIQSTLVPPDLVILDLGLPGADGLEFLRVFRQINLSPVIIVSARESDEDKIRGLGLGADDFVGKPFSPRVLVARAKAQLRRFSLQAGERESLRFGEFFLDKKGRILERAGNEVSLSRREFDILEYLAFHPWQAFKAEELHRAVWGAEFGDLSTVAVHIQRIRKKIEEDPARPKWIRTVPGSGYRFPPEGDAK
jgi:two-component system, OmpR family, response regulator ResD